VQSGRNGGFEEPALRALPSACKSLTDAGAFPAGVGDGNDLDRFGALVDAVVDAVAPLLA
jgi:hypothetical protein